MRIFFCAERTCALFVNGIHLGVVDGFARSTAAEPADALFCELKSEGCVPIRFRLDEDFLFAPPEGVELYFFHGGAAIYARDFVYADPTPRVVWRREIDDMRLTLCVQGRVTLNMERGGEVYQTALPFSFAQCTASRAGGMVLLEGEGAFALVGRDGTRAVLSDGRVTERGARVAAEVPLHDALGHVVRRVWEEGVLAETAILSTRQPTPATFALAFFESLLTGNDPAPYLAPALAAKAHLLGEFLGRYTAVALTGDPAEAALIYPRKPRVFDVRVFRVAIADGKIENISPQE